MGMSQSYGPANERESIATLHYASSRGEVRATSLRGNLPPSTASPSPRNGAPEAQLWRAAAWPPAQMLPQCSQALQTPVRPPTNQTDSARQILPLRCHPAASHTHPDIHQSAANLAAPSLGATSRTHPRSLAWSS